MFTEDVPVNGTEKYVMSFRNARVQNTRADESPHRTARKIFKRLLHEGHRGIRNMETVRRPATCNHLAG